MGFSGFQFGLLAGLFGGLCSRKCNFSMVKTWTNCGESVVIRGSFVIVSGCTKESIKISAFFTTSQPKMRHAKFFGISIELVGTKSD
jgi:hypothetical protein